MAVAIVEQPNELLEILSSVHDSLDDAAADLAKAALPVINTMAGVTRRWSYAGSIWAHDGRIDMLDLSDHARELHRKA